MIPKNLEDAVKTLKESKFPDLVMVEVCGICNLRCIMCPSLHLKRERGFMNERIYKKIIDEIAEKRPETQLWPAIMGEPLLMKDKLIKYITYAKEKGIREVILNTNGTFLTPEVYDELTVSHLDKIIVGLDAFTEKSYNAIRIGGNYKKVHKNLIEILKLNELINFMKLKGPQIILQFIEMEENAGEREQFKEYWLSKGAVIKIRKRLGWGTCVEPHGMDLKPQSKERVPCPWLMRALNIQWTGNVAQCDADYEGTYSVGDIRIQTIEEIWNTEFEKRRARHWNWDFDFMPCRECKDWQAGLSEWYYPDTKTR